MSQGREESNIIKRYLEFITFNKPKRGRKRSPSAIGDRLAAIEAELPEASPLARLHLVQEKLDLTSELERISSTQSMESVEAEFIKVAAHYGERKGISFQAWRETGVRPEILRKAGIHESKTGSNSSKHQPLG
jgi:hypothetical protein